MSWNIVYTAQARQDLLYLPEEPQNTVNIVRIMYGGRNVRRQLSETVL